jgi:hypothetical protein
MYPEDRVLVVIMNNQADWRRVQDEGWYRIPVKHAPGEVPYVDWLAFYFTAKFHSDKWAIHYFAPVQGHELVTRLDLFPAQSNHPRARDTYFKMMLGQIEHKLPPITSHKWRRVTFISTTGDRFANAREVNDLFDRNSPQGQLYVTLKEAGFQVEQGWHIEENQAHYHVDLAVQTAQGWQGIHLTPQADLPPSTLRLSANAPLPKNLRRIKRHLAEQEP